jgi:hypothetical protein
MEVEQNLIERIISLPPEIQTIIYQKLYDLNSILSIISLLEDNKLRSELGTLYANIRRIDIGTPTEVKDYDEIAQYLNLSFTKDFPKLKEINVNVKIKYNDTSEQVATKILSIIKHPLIVNFMIEHKYAAIGESSTMREFLSKKIVDNLPMRYDKYSKSLVNLIISMKDGSYQNRLGFEKGTFYPFSNPRFAPSGEELESLSEIEINTIVNPSSEYGTLSNIREIRTDDWIKLVDFLTVEQRSGSSSERGLREIDLNTDILINEDGNTMNPEEIFIDFEDGFDDQVAYLVFPNIIKFSTAMLNLDLVEVWRYSFPNIKEFVFYNITDQDLINEYNEMYPEFVITNKK